MCQQKRALGPEDPIGVINDVSLQVAGSTGQSHWQAGVLPYRQGLVGGGSGGAEAQWDWGYPQLVTLLQ